MTDHMQAARDLLDQAVRNPVTNRGTAVDQAGVHALLSIAESLAALVEQGRPSVPCPQCSHRWADHCRTGCGVNGCGCGRVPIVVEQVPPSDPSGVLCAACGHPQDWHVNGMKGPCVDGECPCIRFVARKVEPVTTSELPACAACGHSPFDDTEPTGCDVYRCSCGDC